MQTKCQLTANPQTKPTELGCETTCSLLLSTLHRLLSFIIITQREGVGR